MQRSIALLLIGLIFGGGIGFVIAASNNATLDGHDHAAHMAADQAAEKATEHAMEQTMEHAHDAQRSVTGGPDAPGVEIQVVKDPSSGWNLNVQATNFRFAPEHASQSHVAGEGHAHVYVNGSKLARLYGPWMHIAALPGGAATIKVTLNSNDHKALVIGETPVAASVTIQTSE